jgi:hypothetical protein
MKWPAATSGSYCVVPFWLGDKFSERWDDEASRSCHCPGSLVSEHVGMNTFHVESASRPLVDFCVLNNNLIKGLILCVKCLSRF